MTKPVGITSRERPVTRQIVLSEILQIKTLRNPIDYARKRKENMKKIILLIFGIFISTCSASEEDICPNPKVTASRKSVLLEYDTPILKKPLTVYLSGEKYTIIYGDQVFIVPEEIVQKMTPWKLHQAYVSCECGCPQTGGFTIYLNIPAFKYGLWDPWYKIAMNANGFLLSLKHGDKNKRMTDNITPFDKSKMIWRIASS